VSAEGSYWPGRLLASPPDFPLRPGVDGLPAWLLVNASGRSTPIPVMSKLVDLRGRYRRVDVGVDAGHASTNHAAAEEAHDLDDLALRGKLLAAVLVEHVHRMRLVLRDERDAEGPHLGHNWTIARGLRPIAASSGVQVTTYCRAGVS
jgi:hypothetical protein